MANDNALVRFKDLEYYTGKLQGSGGGGSDEAFPDYLLQTLKSDGTPNTGTSSAMSAKGGTFTFKGTSYNVYKISADKPIYVNFAQSAINAEKANYATTAETANSVKRWDGYTLLSGTASLDSSGYAGMYAPTNDINNILAVVAYYLDLGSVVKGYGPNITISDTTYGDKYIQFFGYYSCSIKYCVIYK